jgi:hypothetical protein
MNRRRIQAVVFIGLLLLTTGGLSLFAPDLDNSNFWGELGSAVAMAVGGVLAIAGAFQLWTKKDQA